MTARNLNIRERPGSILRKPPRTRAQIAAELTRLEFERDRVRRELERLEVKRLVATATEARIKARVHKLLLNFAELEARKPPLPSAPPEKSPAPPLAIRSLRR
ncbi:hypothetical protein M2322_004611 [Rhodoblastus acidophilus]|uniref:hypothetical protein n=1 Tax=Rhodoblastus acidophilus TaxID=1074 RepID=UPI0022245C45|nr:hypothetical protein [Rhodoblastus acidophilus]MCW2319042.1 hypothetical protein [Rhodoblastus acidophilus]